jgi:hypothetical protein
MHYGLFEWKRAYIILADLRYNRSISEIPQTFCIGLLSEDVALSKADSNTFLSPLFIASNMPKITVEVDN